MKKIIKRSLLALAVLLLVVVGLYVYRTHEAVKHVEAYKPQVEAQLAKYNLKGDTQLVLAIIYTETKGGSTDVMQSSESISGQTNTVSSQQESINQGIAQLVTILEDAQQKGCDVWTGVQAYNFGEAYVDYVAAHGGVNTLALSSSYSKDVVAPSLGNTTGATYRHLTWDSIFYNGGKLYVDGGNLFYAQEVHGNFDLLKIFG